MIHSRPRHFDCDTLRGGMPVACVRNCYLTLTFIVLCSPHTATRSKGRSQRLLDMAEPDRGARDRHAQGQGPGAGGQRTGMGAGVGEEAGAAGRTSSLRTHPPPQQAMPPPHGMMFQPPRLGLPSVGYHHPQPPPPPPPAFFPGSASLFEQLDKRVMVSTLSVSCCVVPRRLRTCKPAVHHGTGVDARLRLVLEVLRSR